MTQVEPRRRRSVQTTTRYSTKGEPTALLHVNLPASLVQAVRNLADEERRTITSQVALLLEESEELQAYIRESVKEPA